MTNNPRKIDAMTKLGVEVAERVPLLVNRNAFNQHYLDTKAAKLGHMMTPLTPAPWRMARCNHRPQ
jgi:GTP cyclohydrolase II